MSLISLVTFFSMQLPFSLEVLDERAMPGSLYTHFRLIFGFTFAFLSLVWHYYCTVNPVDNLV